VLLPAGNNSHIFNYSSNFITKIMLHIPPWLYKNIKFDLCIAWCIYIVILNNIIKQKNTKIIPTHNFNEYLFFFITHWISIRYQSVRTKQFELLKNICCFSFIQNSMDFKIIFFDIL